MAKIQPAAMKIYFQMPAAKNSGTIDISQCVSQVNRRFYRQGVNWAVSNLKLYSNSTGATILNVATAQDSWVVSNSWHKGFANWMKMSKEFGLDIQPSIRAKFMDFKVFLDEAHYLDWNASIDAGGTGQQADVNDVNGNLVPHNAMSVTPYLPGEWDPSQFIAPFTGSATAGEWYIKIHGADAAKTKSLVYNYEISRSVPQSPDPDTGLATTSIYLDMFDQGTPQTDQVVADILTDNDELPYNQDNYPGGAVNANAPELVAVSGFSATNNSGIIQQFNTGPFNAQCGLIRISKTESTVLNIEMTLVAGDHRGYLCQPMQDV